MEQIKLNTIPSGVPSVCHISQFDNTSRIIRCHLFNGSDPLTLTGSETIRLFVRKSNNSRAEFEIESTSGTFIDLVITSEMSDIAGDSECKFQITDSEKTIGTLNFKMIVEPDAYGDSLKTRSISGPIATFETDLAEDLIKLDVDLEPIQDLHGYDNPWPAGGGKNVVDTRNIDTTTAGIHVTSDADGIISMAGTRDTSTGWKTFAVFSNFTPGDYVFSTNNSHVTCLLNYTQKTSIFTVNTGDVVRLALNLSSGDVVSDTNIKVQIEKGSTATSWSPYSNICPISGHDSAQLFRTGKNLAIKENLNTTYFSMDNDGVFTQNNQSSAPFSWIYSNSIIKISLPAGTYTLTTFAKTISTNPNANVQVIDDSDQRIANNVTMNSKTKSSVSFTLSKNSNIGIVAKIYEGAFYFQLELGSTATDYEPYISDPTPVTVQFGQTVYKGKLYSEQRKVLVTHVGMDLGYFTWNHYVTDTRNYFYSNQPPPISPKGTVSPEINDDISSIYACEKYADVVNGYTYSWIHSGFTLPATTKRLYIYDEAMENSDAASFKTRVTGQQFVYEVAEPFFIDLTQIQTASIDSTPVASFETTLAMPLNTSEHSFSCSQAEGTPTPDSPIPITGVSEITAIRTGKNLCPIFTAYSGNGLTTTVNPDGTIHVTGTATGSGGFITDSNVLGCAIPSDQQITISISNTIPCRLRQFLAGVGRNSTSDINAGEKSTTFSRNFKIASIRLYLFTTAGQSYDFSFKFQIELGSTATPYEPYSGESITVSLGGTYYGGKLVQSEDGSRKIVLSHAQLVLSSANANIINRVNANKYRVFNADYGAKITGSDYADIKCNKMSSQTGTANDNRCYINSTGDIRMNFTSEYNTVADMIAAMESITVVYPLETPIEINLPDGDPLTTIAGENNVYCNTGDTALTYYYNMVADPIRIPALVGTNNVYSDAGDVEVEYYTTLEGGND